MGGSYVQLKKFILFSEFVTKNLYLLSKRNHKSVPLKLKLVQKKDQSWKKLQIAPKNS